MTIVREEERTVSFIESGSPFPMSVRRWRSDSSRGIEIIMQRVDETEPDRLTIDSVAYGEAYEQIVRHLIALLEKAVAEPCLAPENPS